MKLTYDDTVDAAYIYLEDDIKPVGVAKTYSCDPQEVGGQINLDFDAAGRLVGIEVLDARKKLPSKLIVELTTKGRT
jgi:YD repeat-containing protein